MDERNYSDYTHYLFIAWPCFALSSSALSSFEHCHACSCLTSCAGEVSSAQLSNGLLPPGFRLKSEGTCNPPSDAGHCLARFGLIQCCTCMQPHVIDVPLRRPRRTQGKGCGAKHFDLFHTCWLWNYSRATVLRKDLLSCQDNDKIRVTRKCARTSAALPR